MTAYAIGFYDVWDASWRESYRSKIMDLVAKHGGRFLVRLDSTVEQLEGDPPLKTGMVVIEFPSMEHGRSWYNDPAYAPLIKLRQTGSKLDLVLVEGREV